MTEVKTCSYVLTKKMENIVQYFNSSLQISFTFVKFYFKTMLQNLALLIIFEIN